jgi:hypothetical protein
LLRRGERLAVRRLWPLAIPFALSVVSMIVASILVTLRSSEPLSRIAATAPWAALFVVVPLLFTAAARGRSWAIPLLILVTACDQGYWGFRYIYSTQPSPILTLDQLAQAVDVPAAAQPGDLIDSKKTEGLDNMPILRGFRVWPGYVGLVPAMVLPFGNEEVAAQRIAGVKWRVAMSAAPQPVPDPAPRVRLLTNATVSANIPKDVHDIDILSEALVQLPLEGLSGPPGTARILEDRPGRIVVETTAPAPQLLVVTERFHPGWRVSEGETEMEPVPVYGDFLGCVVPAGTHQFTFRFKPKSFQYGLLTTGVGLLIVLSLIPFAI